MVRLWRWEPWVHKMLRRIGVLTLMTVFTGCSNKTGETIQLPEPTTEFAMAAEHSSETTSEIVLERSGDSYTLTADVGSMDPDENGEQSLDDDKNQALDEDENQAQEEAVDHMEMRMTIDGIAVNVVWENNESVDALRALVASEGLEINMSMYGGFEQVGSIGQSIPKKDTQTTTKAGDIVLYSGNQVVIFYGSNSWAYTRLGRITDQTDQELEEMLGNGDVVLRFEVK